VIVVDEVSCDDIAVHSRVIRQLLSDGNISLANKLLDKEYKIKGIHIKGQGLGKKQFVPTINLNCEDFLLPSHGIYVTKSIVKDIEYPSVTFIGHRVTTDGKFAVETHILNNFDDAGMDKLHTVEIKFLHKIRDNKKFEVYEDLKQQILDDIEVAKNKLRNHIER